MHTFKTVLAASLFALPLPALAVDWSGPYAGLQVGGSDIDTNVGVTGDGNSVGGFAGYNFVSGGAVFGAEIDYDETDYSLTGGAGTIDSTLRVKARAGVEIAGGLGYATLGWVQADTSAFGDDNGYLYGIGYDYPVSDSVFVGAELLQHEFTDFGGAAGPDVSVMTFKFRVGIEF